MLEAGFYKKSHTHRPFEKQYTFKAFFNFSLATTLFFFWESLGEAETISSTQIQSVTNHKHTHTHAFKNIWPVWEIDYSQDPQQEPVHTKKVISLHSNVQQLISNVFLYDCSDTCITPLTSSRGSSVSWGRELDSRPTMKGVGVQTMSSIAEGSTGM